MAEPDKLDERGERLIEEALGAFNRALAHIVVAPGSPQPCQLPEHRGKVCVEVSPILRALLLADRERRPPDARDVECPPDCHCRAGEAAEKESPAASSPQGQPNRQSGAASSAASILPPSGREAAEKLAEALRDVLAWIEEVGAEAKRRDTERLDPARATLSTYESTRRGR